MTAESFLTFYPQFTGAFPSAVLDSYITLANARFDEFGEDTEEARRLYVAHKLTLYAKTSPVVTPESGSSVSLSSLASSGEASTVSSKRVENVSVTYASGSSSSSSSSSLADLSETEYGKQLLSLLRLFSFPRYVP